MTAQKLAYRTAMSSLIDLNLECAAAPQVIPSYQVAELPVQSIDLDLLAGDDDLDLMQADAENDFFTEMQSNRQSAAYRRSMRAY